MMILLTTGEQPGLCKGHGDVDETMTIPRWIPLCMSHRLARIRRRRSLGCGDPGLGWPNVEDKKGIWESAGEHEEQEMPMQKKYEGGH